MGIRNRKMAEQRKGKKPFYLPGNVYYQRSLPLDRDDD